VDQLVSKGYEAFASSFASNDKILWRVQIGPKADLARFEPIKLEVDKALRVESVIVRYRQ
jgi:cell division septation protein DedD